MSNNYGNTDPIQFSFIVKRKQAIRKEHNNNNNILTLTSQIRKVCLGCMP